MSPVMHVKGTRTNQILQGNVGIQLTRMKGKDATNLDQGYILDKDTMLSKQMSRNTHTHSKLEM